MNKIAGTEDFACKEKVVEKLFVLNEEIFYGYLKKLNTFLPVLLFIVHFIYFSYFSAASLSLPFKRMAYSNTPILTLVNK